MDPVIKAKIVITSDNTQPGIFDLFHPCQIEKRFGGTAETPTNFWPPQVGNIFKPEKQPANVLLGDEEYEKILLANPELPRHPHFLNSNFQKSRDFVLEKPPV